MEIFHAQESNKLKIFPEGLLQAANLSTLDLSNNDLTHVPPELGGGSTGQNTGKNTGVFPCFACRNFQIQKPIYSLDPQIKHRLWFIMVYMDLYGGFLK